MLGTVVKQLSCSPHLDTRNHPNCYLKVRVNPVEVSLGKKEQGYICKGLRKSI